MFSSIFNPENDFWQFVNQVANVAGLSICWVFLCLPIVTIGASTTALYDAIYHGVRRNERGVYLRFWNTFRANLKVGAIWTVLGLGVALVCAYLMAFSFWVARAGNAPAGGIALSALAVLSGFFLATWLFGAITLSRFEFGFKGLLKTSVQLVFSHLPSAAATVFLTVAAADLCLRAWGSVLLLPGLAMLIVSLMMERIFRPFLPEKDVE